MQTGFDTLVVTQRQVFWSTASQPVNTSIKQLSSRVTHVFLVSSRTTTRTCNSLLICGEQTKANVWAPVHIYLRHIFFFFIQRHPSAWNELKRAGGNHTVWLTPGWFRRKRNVSVTRVGAKHLGGTNNNSIWARRPSKILRSERETWGLGPQTAASTGELPFGARVEGWNEACSPESSFVPVSVVDGLNIKCFHLWCTVVIWSHLKHYWTLWVPLRDSTRAI